MFRFGCFIWLLPAVVLFPLVAKAQLFDSSLGFEEEKPAAQKAVPTQPAAPAVWGSRVSQLAAPAAASSGARTTGASGQNEDLLNIPAATVRNQTPPPKTNVPQIMRPTLDGVERGRTSMSPIAEPGQEAPTEDEFIFLFYTDFKMDGTMGGVVNCDVTFVVLSTLNRKISSLAYRLVWPGMETSLVFEEVSPNTETIYRYSLLGDGCYSMDKIPNVVVNRCRVKGLSQQECAEKIKWITR